MSKPKPEKPKTWPDPNKASRCHPAVEWRCAPIFQVGKDGAEIFIGRARYCPATWWKGKRFNECMGILRVEFSRATWPQDLKPAHFQALIGRHGPGHWLTFGFHVILHDEKWMSLADKSFNYFPPYDDASKLIPLAQTILEFRKRHHIEGTDPTKEWDGKAKAAGDDPEDVPF